MVFRSGEAGQESGKPDLGLDYGKAGRKQGVEESNK